MTRGRIVTVLAVVGVMLLAVGVFAAARQSPSQEQASGVVGSSAPDLSGRTLEGRDYAWRPRGGVVTVVNIWASWCGPCREEMPLLAVLDGHPGLELVTVNTRDSAPAARSFLDGVGANDVLTVLDPDGRTAVAWGARGVPETFVIGGDGAVRERHAGPVDAAWVADLRRRVDEGRLR